MKDHKGMRPQDIVILLAIVAQERKGWEQTGWKILEGRPQNKDLAGLLNISTAEISAAIYRSSFSRLLELDSRKVFLQSLFEFLVYGIKYVFPVQPSALVRGIPTAHSAEPMKNKLLFQEEMVWEYPEGTVRGQAIVPLYHTVPSIAGKNSLLYELLSIVDSIRTGGARETEIAVKELENRFFEK